jgi:hypothetical protein
MIEQIRSKVAANRFEFSQHAVDVSIVRHIAVDEIRQAIATGKIIESYPNDKYGPSCLVFGLTQVGRPIHIQCSHPVREPIKIITLYEPDPSLWIEFETRKP